MKLRNTKNQMVRIRLPKQRINLLIKPLEVIEVDMKMRQAILPFMIDFGLKLEADDADFHKNADIPKDQNPPTTKELLNEKTPAVVDEDDEPSNKEMEGLFFAKDGEESKQTDAEEYWGTKESSPGGGDDLEDVFSGLGEPGIDDTSGADEQLVEVPDTCPYTKTELVSKVKAELWEICEKLGLEQEGTKTEIIQRIVEFYKLI